MIGCQPRGLQSCDLGFIRVCAANSSMHECSVACHSVKKAAGCTTYVCWGQVFCSATLIEKTRFHAGHQPCSCKLSRKTFAPRNLEQRIQRLRAAVRKLCFMSCSKSRMLRSVLTCPRWMYSLSTGAMASKVKSTAIGNLQKRDRTSCPCAQSIPEPRLSEPAVRSTQTDEIGTRDYPTCSLAGIYPAFAALLLVRVAMGCCQQQLAGGC